MDTEIVEEKIARLEDLELERRRVDAKFEEFDSQERVLIETRTQLESELVAADKIVRQITDELETFQKRRDSADREVNGIRDELMNARLQQAELEGLQRQFRSRRDELDAEISNLYGVLDRIAAEAAHAPQPVDTVDTSLQAATANVTSTGRFEPISLQGVNDDAWFDQDHHADARSDPSEHDTAETDAVMPPVKPPHFQLPERPIAAAGTLVVVGRTDRIDPDHIPPLPQPLAPLPPPGTRPPWVWALMGAVPASLVLVAVLLFPSRSSAPPTAAAVAGAGIAADGGQPAAARVDPAASPTLLSEAAPTPVAAEPDGEPPPPPAAEEDDSERDLEASHEAADQGKTARKSRKARAKKPVKATPRAKSKATAAKIEPRELEE